jgi:hypothetical protein
MSKSELAFLTARLCKSRSSIRYKSQFWNSNHHLIGMMLEICSMICIRYAMRHSKCNLTPMICYHWVVVASLWCVALLSLGSKTSFLLGFQVSMKLFYKWVVLHNKCICTQLLIIGTHRTVIFYKVYQRHFKCLHDILFKRITFEKHFIQGITSTTNKS